MRLEKMWHDSARHDNAHPKLVIACIAVTLGVVSCTPFVVAGTWSLEEARAICEKRKFSGGDLTAEEVEIMNSNNQAYYLSPRHEFLVRCRFAALLFGLAILQPACFVGEGGRVGQTA